MRVVKIQLVRPGTFWFYNNVKLGPGNTLTEPFDFDALSEGVRDHILRSQNVFHYIKIVDQPEGVWPTMEIQELDDRARYELPRPPGTFRPAPVPQSKPRQKSKQVQQPKKPVEQPKSAQPKVPEVQEEPPVKAVTVEPDEEDVILACKPTEEDFAEATVLLKQNGNTVKSVARNMSHTAASRSLLKACIESEREGKNRIGVLQALEDAFSAIPPGAA